MWFFFIVPRSATKFERRSNMKKADPTSSAQPRIASGDPGPHPRTLRKGPSPAKTPAKKTSAKTAAAGKTSSGFQARISGDPGPHGK
jgi:hypothetical protein